MKNFATIISLVVALIVVQPQKVEAQTLQQQEAQACCRLYDACVPYYQLIDPVPYVVIVAV
jgi:hypothetical protein